MELLPCGRHCSRWEAPRQRPHGSIDFRSVCEQFCAVKSLAPSIPPISRSSLIFGNVSSHAYGELEPYCSPSGPTGSSATMAFDYGFVAGAATSIRSIGSTREIYEAT
ncbi:hypothetical protein K0M31_008674, partial [Melipona bicolor]